MGIVGSVAHRCMGSLAGTRQFVDEIGKSNWSTILHGHPQSTITDLFYYFIRILNRMTGFHLGISSWGESSRITWP